MNSDVTMAVGSFAVPLATGFPGDELECIGLEFIGLVAARVVCLEHSDGFMPMCFDDIIPPCEGIPPIEPIISTCGVGGTAMASAGRAAKSAVSSCRSP
jgi:hypothetical protein